jgi:putative transcriptional regulator
MQALTVCLSYFMESKLDILCFSDILNLWKVNFTYRRERRLKNKLEELRKQRGIKQEDLANALAVSRQTIGSLENGRYNPSIILAFKIARYFGVRIEDIFIFEEDEDE